MNRDRPLTDAQERALLALAEHTTDHKWIRPGMYRCRTNTLESLDRLGLARWRRQMWSLDREYQITDDGLAMLDSMGD